MNTLNPDTVRLKSTGGRINVDWVHVFEVRNGKVARFREYFDSAPIVAELSVAQSAVR